MSRWTLHCGELKFTLDRNSGNEVVLDGESFSFCYSPEGLYRIRVDQKYHDVLIERTGPTSLRAYIDHLCLNVILEDELDASVSISRSSGALTPSEASVLAPMPGLVTSVEVNAGDRVGVGSRLVILEAMKMENQIRSRVAGIVRNIKVKPGETVEKGQILLLLEGDK